MYRASVGITTSMNVSATSWIGENADSLGIDGIWVGEDIGIGQETSILSADLLSKTIDVRVGTGIVPITIHNIATIARAALTLHEVGNGRYVQGVGVGGIQDLVKQGKQLTKPVTELRKATQVLRQLFKTESVTIQTELMTLREFSLRINEPVNVPIFYGVRGPQMLKLSGNEIIRILKIQPGPKIGQILDILLDYVLSDPKKNKKAFLGKEIKKLGKLSDKELNLLSQKAKKEREKIEMKRDEMTKKKYWVT